MIGSYFSRWHGYKILPREMAALLWKSAAVLHRSSSNASVSPRTCLRDDNSNSHSTSQLEKSRWRLTQNIREGGRQKSKSDLKHSLTFGKLICQEITGQAPTTGKSTSKKWIWQQKRRVWDGRSRGQVLESAIHVHSFSICCVIVFSRDQERGSQQLKEQWWHLHFLNVLLDSHRN